MEPCQKTGNVENVVKSGKENSLENVAISKAADESKRVKYLAAITSRPLTRSSKRLVYDCKTDSKDAPKSQKRIR